MRYSFFDFHLIINIKKKLALNATGCRYDSHSRKCNIYLNLYFHFFALVSRQSAALSSATQHAMRPKFDGNWETGHTARS